MLKKFKKIKETYKETKKLLATFDEYEDIYRLLNVNTVHKLNKKVENSDICKDMQ